MLWSRAHSSNLIAQSLKKMSTRFKPKFNIKKGDSVVVITGEDKDLKKPRKVLEVILEKGKVLIEGANIVTKHTKPTAQNTKGGIQKVVEKAQLSKFEKRFGTFLSGNAGREDEAAAAATDKARAAESAKK